MRNLFIIFWIEKVNKQWKSYGTIAQKSCSPKWFSELVIPKIYICHVSPAQTAENRHVISFFIDCGQSGNHLAYSLCMHGAKYYIAFPSRCLCMINLTYLQTCITNHQIMDFDIDSWSSGLNGVLIEGTTSSQYLKKSSLVSWDNFPSKVEFYPRMKFSNWE